MDSKVIGPLLSEAELFSLLDGSKPALSEVKEAAKSKDLAKAKRLFSDHIRLGGYAEFFFKNRETISNRIFFSVDDEKLKADAERVLSHELISVGVPYKFGKDVDWFHNATYNGYKEWTWQLSRHYDLRILAAAYEKFGDEKYAEGLVELLLSWIRQAVRPDADVGDGATLCWRTIECGIRMSTWPNLFFPILKSPAATDDFIVAFFSSLYEHGERLVRSKTQNNWRNIELSGFASLVVLFPVFEITGAWREHTAKGVYDHLVRQIHPDGFQFELSTGYHNVVLKEAMHGAAALKLSGHKMPDDFEQTVAKMFEMYVKLAQAGTLIPNINDGRSARLKSFMPKDGEITETPLIKWAKAGCPKEGAPDENTLVLFEYAGLVTMRDSWFDTKASLFFDAGKLGRSHQHEDKLNVLVYYNGKELITEGHNYAYDTSEIRKYILSTFSHNTVSVDGKGQNRKKSYKWDDAMLTEKEPVITSTTDAIDYAKGTYNEAYGEEQEITDVTHTREVALVKKPKAGDGAVIVIDTLCGDMAHSFEAMWHTDTEELSLLGNVARGENFSIAFGADVGELSIVKGVTEPSVQGFTARSTIQGDYDAIPTVLNTLSAKEAKMLTVISLGARIKTATLTDGVVNITYENGEKDEITLP